MLDRVTQLSLFIYKRSTKNKEKNLNKNISVAWNMVKNTINISEEGDENDSRDSANDLLPCSEAFE